MKSKKPTKTARKKNKPEKYVLAPGGFRPVSTIKQARKVSKTVKKIAPVSTVRKTAAAKVKSKKPSGRLRTKGLSGVSFQALHFNDRVVLNDIDAGGNPNWVAYGSWRNQTANPVQSFRVSWEVPPAPATDNGQTIFIFPGLQNDKRIVQPVLQWGESGAGGGSFWAISTWYAGDAATTAQFSQLVPVNPGDRLTGFIQLNSASGERFSYTSGFEGRDATLLNAPPISELTEVCLTLESYNISALTDYPPIEKTSMAVIEANGKTAPLPVVWRTPAPAGGFGEHAVIIPVPGAISNLELFY